MKHIPIIIVAVVLPISETLKPSNSTSLLVRMRAKDEVGLTPLDAATEVIAQSSYLSSKSIKPSADKIKKERLRRKQLDDSRKKPLTSFANTEPRRVKN